MTEAEWLACTDPITMIEFLRGSPTGEDAVTWWRNRWQFGEPVGGKDRKFRLFTCACCRRIWDQIPEACNREAVAAVEDYLEGRLPASALEAAFVASSAVEWKEDGSGRRGEPGYWAVKYLGRRFYKMTAAASALLVASQVAFMADGGYGWEAQQAFDGCYYTAAGIFFSPFRWPPHPPDAVVAELVDQVALLRCLFSDPFRASPPLPPAVLAWNDGTVRRIAEAIYEDRQLPAGTLDTARLAVLADALLDAGCDDEELIGHCRAEGPHVRGCWAVDLVLGKS